MIQLFIVDDHQIIIDGIKALLKEVQHIQVVGSAQDGTELMYQLSNLQPDILLLDIGMPKMDGIAAALQVKKKYPNIKILIFTTYSDPQKVKKALKVGVEGYLLKGSGRATLIHALDEIMAGRSYHDQRIVDGIMKSLQGNKKSSPTALTKREIEVVKLVVEGYKTKEIAKELFLSPLTVETHRKNIFSKLGINKVTALVRYAMEQGWVE